MGFRRLSSTALVLTALSLPARGAGAGAGAGAEPVEAVSARVVATAEACLDPAASSETVAHCLAAAATGCSAAPAPEACHAALSASLQSWSGAAILRAPLALRPDLLQARVARRRICQFRFKDALRAQCELTAELDHLFRVRAALGE